MSNIVEQLGQDKFEQIIRTKLTEHILKNGLPIPPPFCYVREVKEDNGKTFVTMEFVEGKSMIVTLKDNELIPVDEPKQKKKK